MYSFFLRKITALMCCVLFVGFAQGAWGGIGHETPEATEIEPLHVQLIIVQSQDRFEAYSGEQLAAALNNEQTDPTEIYSDAQGPDSSAFINVFLFKSVDVLNSFDSETLALFASRAQAGEFFGLIGGDAALRQALDAFDPGDKGETSDPENYAYFMYGVPDGDREDLYLGLDENPTVGSLLDLLTDWIAEVLEKHAFASQADSGAWDATYTQDWRGTMDGGSYRFLVNVFKLNTTNPTKNWFLVTTSYQSEIDDYRSNSGRCGWYTNAMNLKATVDTTDGALLYDYMPTGTVGDTTKGFSIGGSLGTDSVGGSAEYSESYTTPDAVIRDNSSYASNRAEWNISFKEPNYLWWPFYGEPADVARNSYQVAPSFIVQVPKTKPLKLKLRPKISHRDDDLSFRVVVLKVSPWTTYWPNGDLSLRVAP